jgi:hypothetical protein
MSLLRRWNDGGRLGLPHHSRLPKELFTNMLKRSKTLAMGVSPMVKIGYILYLYVFNAKSTENEMSRRTP